MLLPRSKMSNYYIDPFEQVEELQVAALAFSVLELTPSIVQHTKPRLAGVPLRRSQQFSPTSIYATTLIAPHQALLSLDAM